LKDANTEKSKIKKEGDTHLENYLKEKKDINSEKDKMASKITELMGEKLKNDVLLKK